MDHSPSPHPRHRLAESARANFVGRGLRDVWAHFTTELQAGVATEYPQVTPASNQVMLLIEPGGTSVSELARRAGMTKQSMAEAVHVLESAGLVHREPDPNDRRAKLVMLTEEGWRGLRHGFDVVTAMHERWTTLLGEDDMRTLIELLERLARLLDEQPPG